MSGFKCLLLTAFGILAIVSLKIKLKLAFSGGNCHNILFRFFNRAFVSKDARLEIHDFFSYCLFPVFNLHIDNFIKKHLDKVCLILYKRTQEQKLLT